MIFVDSSFFIAIVREKDKWHSDFDKINEIERIH